MEVMYKILKLQLHIIQIQMILHYIHHLYLLLNVFIYTYSIVWPGELGFLSNYALVYAKLIYNGKNKGVHPFMV